MWEPTTGNIIMTVAIPRGQTIMATGKTTADATSFTLKAVRGSTVNGISSNPFLEHAFRADAHTITKHEDGTWSSEQETTLTIHAQSEPFAHADRNTLHKIGKPTPNATARAAVEI